MAFLHILIIFTQVPIELLAFTSTTADVCGFEQKCAHDNENRLKSCCRQCECSDICAEKGTCCFDHGYKNVTKQECIAASYIPRGRHSHSAHHTYFVRTRCPESFGDLQIKEKCATETPQTLDDVIFVSSEDGAIVYKNRFCGLCYGEQKTVSWEVMISFGCVKQIFREEGGLSVGKAVEIVLTECELMFRRPDETPIGSVLCHNGMLKVSECNKSGEWEKYDSRLLNLCLDPTESLDYYHQTLTRVIVYRNQYCYLCNRKSPMAPETCDQQTMDKHRFTSSMMTLVDTSEKYRESNERQKSKNTADKSLSCLEGMIFDTFLGLCKKVYCPMMTVPVEDKCIPMVEGGFGYRIDTQLVSDIVHHEFDVDDNDIKYLYAVIRNQLKLMKCIVCRGSMYIPRNYSRTAMSEIYVQLVVTPTQKCKRNRILANVAALETSNFTATGNFSQKLIRFFGYIREPATWENTQWKKISMIGDAHCLSHFSDRRSNCPKIKLTSDEYDRVLQHHIRPKELLFSSNPGNAEDGVYVCLDNYSEIQEGAAVTNHISFSAIIATSIVSMTISFDILWGYL